MGFNDNFTDENKDSRSRLKLSWNERKLLKTLRVEKKIIKQNRLVTGILFYLHKKIDLFR